MVAHALIMPSKQNESARSQSKSTFETTTIALLLFFSLCVVLATCVRFAGPAEASLCHEKNPGSLPRDVGERFELQLTATLSNANVLPIQGTRPRRLGCSNVNSVRTLCPRRGEIFGDDSLFCVTACAFYARYGLASRLFQRFLSSNTFVRPIFLVILVLLN